MQMWGRLSTELVFSLGEGNVLSKYGSHTLKFIKSLATLPVTKLLIFCSNPTLDLCCSCRRTRGLRRETRLSPCSLEIHSVTGTPA